MMFEVYLLPRPLVAENEAELEALEAAWRGEGFEPSHVVYMSVDAAAIGHYALSATATTAAIAGAVSVLKTWLQARANRQVLIRLGDGTELRASTPKELDRLAATAERLNRSRNKDRDVGILDADI